MALPKDVAVSSREISVGLYGNEVRLSQLGIPGPVGPPGKGLQGDPGVGNYQGYFDENQSYHEKDLVSWSPADVGVEGVGVGLYYCIQDPPTLNYDPSNPEERIKPNNTAFWQIMVGPGGRGQSVEYAGVWGPGNFPYEADISVVTHEGQTWIARQTHDSSAETEPQDNSEYWDLIVARGQTAYFEGEWKTEYTYTAGLSIVTHLGESYIAETDNRNVAPSHDSADWSLIAAKGEDGDPGVEFRGAWQPGQDYYAGRSLVTYIGATWIALNDHESTEGDPPWPDDSLNNWAVFAARGEATRILSAGRPPLASEGDEGEYFLNTATARLYGPKDAEDGWGAGITLRGADAISWLSFHFESTNGTRRLVVPESARLYAGDVTTYGTGNAQIYVNGSIVSSTTNIAVGDRIAVVASGVSGDFMVTLKIGPPAG